MGNTDNLSKQPVLAGQKKPASASGCKSRGIWARLTRVNPPVTIKLINEGATKTDGQGGLSPRLARRESPNALGIQPLILLKAYHSLKDCQLRTGSFPTSAFAEKG